MPITTAFKTEIPRVSILDEQGNFDEKLGKGLIPDADLVKLYEAMFACRHLDGVAFRLQRSGRMGTYPQNMGQEATSLGAAYVLSKNDWLVTCYRENCGLFWRGVPMESILLHWMGDERGNAMPREHHATPIAVPIGTQMLHATGLAWAAKYRGEKQIACTFFGDGATNHAAFNESLNFAGFMRAPVVFVCENNLYATATALSNVTLNPEIATRAAAYGIPGVAVDGNDVVAMWRAMKAATERARRGEGPTLIEAKTYRTVGHHEGDPVTGIYRTQAEVDEWAKRCPIKRLRDALVDELELAKPRELDAIDAEIDRAVAGAIDFARKRSEERRVGKEC